MGIATQFLLTHPHHRGLVTGLALAAYGVGFAAGLVAVAVRRYAVVPKGRWLTDAYAAQLATGQEDVVRPLLGQLVGKRVLAIEHNAKVDKVKSWGWWVSVASLAVGLLFSTISLSS